MIKFFKILSGKFTSRHRSTLFCTKFVKIVRREIGEIVRYLHLTKKHFFGSLSISNCVDTARIAPKVCHGQPPTFGSQHSKFHPNRFTFGGVIAVRVKAVKMRLKVSRRLRVVGEAIATHRVNKHASSSFRLVTLTRENCRILATINSYNHLFANSPSYFTLPLFSLYFA